MTVKEKLEAIKAALAGQTPPVEDKPADDKADEGKADGGEPADDKADDGEAEFSVSEEQFNALSKEIFDLKAELAEIKTASAAYAEGEAKLTKSINDLFDVVVKMSETSDAKPVETTKSGFQKFGKENREANEKKLAERMKAFREQKEAGK
jgi:hypothetical protein